MYVYTLVDTETDEPTIVDYVHGIIKGTAQAVNLNPIQINGLECYPITAKDA